MMSRSSLPIGRPHYSSSAARKQEGMGVGLTSYVLRQGINGPTQPPLIPSVKDNGQMGQPGAGSRGRPEIRLRATEKGVP